jgi:hypothetical protein
MQLSSSRSFGALLGVLLYVGAPSFAASQEASDGGSSLPAGVFAGSERERYLRALQTAGLVRPYPWDIRGFSPLELDRLRPLSERHPWADHPGFTTTPRRAGAIRLELLPASIASWYNTAFPFGINDGAVWAGRGLTTAAQVGAAARWGPLSIVVAPTAFWAQNRPFRMTANGQTGNLQFADPLFPLNVDRPQRFGERAYSVVDPGQTTIRVDVLGVAVGASTANQWWGPMTELPYLLGSNAAGFPHAFLGTSKPANLGLGRVHVRVVYGELAQSSYTNITGPERRRFASGIVGVFSPRGLSGLELGGARFFHTPWPVSGIGWPQLRKPLESLFKAGPNVTDPNFALENQLGSLFGRWVLPRGGFEIFGEYGRDDYNAHTTDLLQEPDHAATYGLGMQKVWTESTGGTMTVLRGELMNFEVPVLARLNRGPRGSTYLHSIMRQGHAHRGQLLGAGFAVHSAAGAMLRAERYTRRGRISFEWWRLVRQENRNVNEPPVRCATCVDVQHVLRAERLQTFRRLDLRYALAFTYELNRDFARDATNWTPEVELRWHP